MLIGPLPWGLDDHVRGLADILRTRSRGHCLLIGSSLSAFLSLFDHASMKLLHKEFPSRVHPTLAGF